MAVAVAVVVARLASAVAQVDAPFEPNWRVNIGERRQSNTERGKFGIGGRQSGRAIAVRERDLFVLGLKQRN